MAACEKVSVESLKKESWRGIDDEVPKPWEEKDRSPTSGKGRRRARKDHLKRQWMFERASKSPIVAS